jgi:hypothetical protein
MHRRDALALGAGALAGIVVVGALWTVRPSADGAETDPTTTTTAPVWATPLEARIGPSVVFPTALEAADGEVQVGYDVRNALATAGDEPASAAAAPARWTLIGPDFEVTEEVVAPTSRAVRFPVPPGFRPDATTVLRLDAYWVAAGVEFPLTIERSSAAWYPIGPGLQARLVDALVQPDNAIVIVEVDGPQALTESMTITGYGREWVSSSRSMLGSHRWTLDYRGADLPDPLPLVVRGVQWFEVDATVTFDLEAILP